MTKTTGVLTSLVQELERTWRRTEAAVDYALKPSEPLVGQSPKSTVWTRNKAKLYRYEPRKATQHATPLLLVYALINKPYILDLMPGNSVVEYLLDQGYDVYLLDWGIPGEEDAGLQLSDYVLDYLPRAVNAVLATSGSEHVSMLGYCMGGTLAALYAATTADQRLKNLVLLTTPIDFADAGLYSAWLDPKHFDVDRVVDTYGLIPADMIDLGGKLLKPVPNYLGPYVGLWDRLDDPTCVAGWQAINHWVNDGIPFAGEAYRQWIKDFYQRNRLVKGDLTLGGKPVLLGNIRCSLLNVYAELDHIALPCQSKPLAGLVGSEDVETVGIPAGHVGVVMGKAAKQTFLPKLNSWLAQRSVGTVARHSH